MDEKKPTYGLPGVREPTKDERKARRGRLSLQPFLLRYHDKLLEKARGMKSAEELFEQVVERGRKSGVLGP